MPPTSGSGGGLTFAAFRRDATGDGVINIFLIPPGLRGIRKVWGNTL